MKKLFATETNWRPAARKELCAKMQINEETLQ